MNHWTLTQVEYDENDTPHHTTIATSSNRSEMLKIVRNKADTAYKCHVTEWDGEDDEADIVEQINADEWMNDEMKLVAAKIAKHSTNVKGLEAYDAAVIAAHQQPGKLAKVQAGWYLVELDGELVQIAQRNSEDEINIGWWNCHQVNHRWDGDPMPTLKEIKFSLGIK